MKEENVATLYITSSTLENIKKKLKAAMYPCSHAKFQRRNSYTF